MMSVALIDAHNFFVSCELVFQPAWQGKPLIVLSSDRGCVLSRSDEARALGIPMGAPFFEIERFCQRHNVILRTGQFALYRNMSHRLMLLLRQIPFVKVYPYSVDEAFVCSEPQQVLTVSWARSMVHDIERFLGIPVSIGLGQTQTQAKVAQSVARHHPHRVSAFRRTAYYLSAIAIEDVWGIGRARAAHCRQHGFYNVWLWMQACEDRLRSQMRAPDLYPWYELQGQARLPWPKAERLAKSHQCARRFRFAVSSLEDVTSYVYVFLEQAMMQLWLQRQSTASIELFLIAQGRRSLRIPVLLPYPCRYLQEAWPQVKEALQHHWQAQTVYIKAGVRLSSLSTAMPQRDWLGHTAQRRQESDHSAVMQTICAIRQRFGSEALGYARALPIRHYRAISRPSQRSPAYTTSWKELLLVM